MLKVYHSNQLESLALRLGSLLGQAPGSWSTPDVILVQSQGMQRWLSVALAAQLGISANLAFPFPANFVWEVYRQVLGDLPDSSSDDPEPLFWRILKVLQQLPEDDVRLQPLRQFLAPTDAWEQAELATQLAVLLDRYQVFRADWIHTWDNTAPSHWQAWLWQRLSAGGAEHRVSLHRRALEALSALREPPAGLPTRVSVFGIAALPPLYLEVLQALSNCINVHLFLLNPCQEYWGLIRAEREIAHQYGDNPETIDLYLETGNRLLASLGRLGRDTHHLLTEIEADTEELFECPGEASLLQALQSDILYLRNRGDNCREDETEGLPITPLAPDDTSIRIQVCHTPMREVEVLHDQLLALLAERPGLSAADIVVMSPDIETYAPAIRAVFATGEPRIPFSLADRRPVSRSPLVEALLGLLALSGSRYPVDEVLTLLECPPLRERFGLSENDLGSIITWLRETGVRWGVDAASRARLKLPETAEHTWEAGLQRLLLGFAMPADESQLYRGMLPYDGVEGESARVMGRLVRFSNTLVRHCEALQQPRSPVAWRQTLEELLTVFFSDADEDSERELALLREVLETLSDSAAIGDYTTDLDLGGLRYWLQAHLGDAGSEGFLGGGVTFCTLMPMRSVPFRVVCLIGLNDGSLPRTRGHRDIDLIARHPRRGDRSRRWEDRYLFLEAIISAREVLYLSYVGASVRDNKPIPPAVLLSELQDYIQQGFRTANGDDPLEQIRTQHPLQAFSPRYFQGDERWFSYASFLCEALQQQQAPPPVRSHTRLDDVETSARTVELSALLAFFQHPVRYLLRERLAIRIPEQEAPPQPREPFDLENWVDIRLRERLLVAQQGGESPEALLPRVRAAGLLPHGTPGEVRYWQQVGILQPLLRALEQAPASLPEPPQVALTLGEFQLRGSLVGVTPIGRLDHGVQGLRPGLRLALWIQHLALNCLAPDGVVPRSRWLGLGPSWQLQPVARADEYLQDLLALYWEGLHRPLPLFPRSTWAWSEAGGGEQGLEKARQYWQGHQQLRGDGEDAYNRLVFAGHDPIDGEFADLAARLWLPLREHSEDA